MDNNNNDNATSSSPILCTAGCGFFGTKAFNNMCSKCYKSNNKSLATATIEKKKLATITAPLEVPSPSISYDTSIIPTIEKSRKHVRSPSPDEPRINSAPASSIASPAPSSELLVPSDNTLPSSSSSTPAATTSNEKPIQTNKGRCFKCRLKVPLAKQAANKCRCGYVFCDNHRYPDRHDCDIDYAKMDREILAKNNPKLHERPRGGRSFQRIDSL